MPRHFYFLFALLLIVAVTGCSGGGIWSPDVDHNTAKARSAQYRTVVRGDTLFGIAWDIGVDFRTLAKWNGIKPPYVIKPGQHLRITAPTKRAAKNQRKNKLIRGSATTTYRVKKGDTVYSIARKTGTRPSQLIRWNKLRKPYTIRTGQRLKISKLSSRSQRQGAVRSKNRRATTHRARTISVTTRPKSVGRWVWPAKGKILRRFTQNGTNKGLDIGGRAGTAILAAAGGRVVYQGSGLRGYGKLIIIKHNSDYLSAYAHSESILVKEGSRVKRGQRIATMGKTGTSRVKLHFEIRLRGNPVNPLHYLPSKP